MAWYDGVKFSDLEGKTLSAIEVRRDGDDEIIFAVAGGEQYRMYHSQDCCESVDIDDINGDLEDLIDTPILVAEERVSENDGVQRGEWGENYTWTFYTIRTIKGTVTIRWYGTSNGYYSESVNFEKVAA